MKHTTPDPLYVSSNFGPRRRGGRSAAAASRAKKSAITSAQSKTEFLANDGDELSSPSTGSPANKPKRRDAKSTPPSHNATKAKELAGRKVGLSKGEADPVADLVSGSGASKPQAPLDRASLAGTSKTLFSEPSGDGKKKKVAPKPKKKSFLDVDEETALQLAIEQAEEERKNQTEPDAADEV